MRSLCGVLLWSMRVKSFFHFQMLFKHWLNQLAMVFSQDVRPHYFASVQ